MSPRASTCSSRTDAGRNENPCWAPDGRHIVFSSNREGGTQIWTMLADGYAIEEAHHAGQEHATCVEMKIAYGVHLEFQEKPRTRMNKRKISLIVLGFMLFMAATGCRKKVAPPPPPPPPKEEPPPPAPPAKPSISQFAAEPSTIQRGQSSTLSWDVGNATEISINEGVGSVQARGSRQVSPTDTTTYTLSVRGAGGTDYANDDRESYRAASAASATSAACHEDVTQRDAGVEGAGCVL